MASTTPNLVNSTFGTSHTIQPHPSPPHRGALRLAPSDPEQDLIWTITPAADGPGNCRWHISTTTKDRQPKRLDLLNDRSGNRTRMLLADPGFYSGQFWQLTPCKGEKDVAKLVKLSNGWTGPGWFLTADAETGVLCMRQGEDEGQKWFVDVPPQLVEEGMDTCCDLEAQQDGLRTQRVWRFEAVRLLTAMVLGFVVGRLWDRFVF